MAFPTFIAAGTAGAGTTSCSPGVPAGISAGDLLILAVESIDGENPATPSGWNQVTVVFNLGTGATRCTLFSRVATSSESAPTVTGTSDHIYGVITGWRHASGTPVISTIFQFAGGASTTASAAGNSQTATFVADTLGVWVIGHTTDSNVGQVSAYASTNFANIVEVFDGGTDTGNGGGIGIGTGEKAAIGMITSQMSATLATSIGWSTYSVLLAPPNTGSAPYIKSLGQQRSGAAAVAYPLPPDFNNDDLLVCFVETANETVTVPSGWSDSGWTAQGTGTAASTTATRLTAFYRSASGVTRGGTVSVADPGDHQVGQTYAIAMPSGGSTPALDAFAGDVLASANSAVTIPAVTTGAANALILAAVAVATDAFTAPTQSATNATLSDERFVGFAASTAGNGGGFSVFSGTKATAGSAGTFTATVTSSVQARMAISFVASSVAIPGVKVWSGSAWVEKPAKVWTGSAWTQKPVKTWNGSAWT